MMKKLWVLSILCAFVLSSCGPDIYRSQQKRQGPPAHAPAWGYYKNHPRYYYYYPGVDVYLDISAHRYYYLNDGTWFYASRLPHYYPNKLGKRVRVWVEGNRRPYYYHRNHQKKYSQRPKYRPSNGRNDDNTRPKVSDRGKQQRPDIDRKKENKGKGNNRPRPKKHD